jgi:hypothetical protein
MMIVRRSAAGLVLFLALAAVTGASAAGKAGEAAGSAPCAAPEYRQFDFFSGEWDAYDAAGGDTLIARNHVTPMLGGCALREDYEQRDGLSGESFSAYDASRRVWHQSWVTNRGQLLLLEGGLEAGRMVLTARERGDDGRVSLLRGVWWQEGAEVRERATRSRDGGATWGPVFDIRFRKHAR